LSKALWDKMKADMDRPSIFEKFMGKDPVNSVICIRDSLDPQTNVRNEDEERVVVDDYQI
jgi:hypothetical protein